MKFAKGKYLQIADKLRQEILSGRYENVERFPSEVALSRRFDASRPTVERALRALKQEGLLSARVGSGVFITKYARQAGGTLAIIAPDYRRIDFFTRYCDMIVKFGREAGYAVQIGDDSVPDGCSRDEWILAVANACVRHKVAGVLLEPVDLVARPHEATAAALRVFAKHGIPVVLLDRDCQPYPGRSSYDLIGIDNMQAGYRLGMHMIEVGAGRIRFLTQSDYATTIEARIHGVAMANYDRHRPRGAFDVIAVDSADPAGFERVIRSAADVDAFICRNDSLAERLLETLKKLRRRVPGDVMVAGFDDAHGGSRFDPPLTTIRQPVDLLAATAVETLLQRIRNPELAPRTVLLDARLVVRESTRPISEDKRR